MQCLYWMVCRGGLFEPAACNHHLAMQVLIKRHIYKVRKCWLIYLFLYYTLFIYLLLFCSFSCHIYVYIIYMYIYIFTYIYIAGQIVVTATWCTETWCALSTMPTETGTSSTIEWPTVSKRVRHMTNFKEWLFTYYFEFFSQLSKGQQNNKFPW